MKASKLGKIIITCSTFNCSADIADAGMVSFTPHCYVNCCDNSTVYQATYWLTQGYGEYLQWLYIPHSGCVM